MAKKMKDLISAAQELNDVLGLDPEIEVEDVTEEELVTEVTKAASLVDLENDELSKKTLDTLRAYDIPVGEEEEKEENPAKSTKGKAEKAKEDTPAPKGKKPAPKKEEIEDDEDDEDEEETPKASAKGSKAAPAKKEKEEAKEPKKKVGKAKEGPSFEEIAKGLVKEGKSEKEILKTFVELYKQKGQTDTEYIKKRVAIYVKIAGKK